MYSFVKKDGMGFISVRNTDAFEDEHKSKEKKTLEYNKVMFSSSQGILVVHIVISFSFLFCFTKSCINAKRKENFEYRSY